MRILHSDFHRLYKIAFLLTFKEVFLFTTTPQPFICSYFADFGSLIEVRWSHKVILVLIFLLTNDIFWDISYPFYFVNNSLYRSKVISSPPILKLICLMDSLYSLDINLLSDIELAKILFLSVGFFFTQLVVSLYMQKLFSMKFHLPVIGLNSGTNEDLSEIIGFFLS